MSLPFTRLMHSYWRVFTKIKVKRESTIQQYFAQMSIILKKKSGNFVKYATFTSTIDKGLQKDTCILNSNSHYYFFSYSLIWNWNGTYVHTFPLFARKPHPIPNQNGQILSKTMKRHIPIWLIQCTREYPPGTK